MPGWRWGFCDGDDGCTYWLPDDLSSGRTISGSGWGIYALQVKGKSGVTLVATEEIH